ncbi:solute carrier family 23 member 2-like [Ornithodoros turicata]|uniref:solute carrier family 23 member 2-like n=1 Tax=Ornithodoros turicata TaxID=34597 RepID=UPI00313899DA
MHGRFDVLASSTDVTDFQRETPPRLQDDSGMPTSSKNRFHFLGKLRPKLPAMLRFDKEQRKRKKKLAAFYDITDQPIFMLTFFLSLQHYITTQAVFLVPHKMLASLLCLDDNEAAVASLIGTATFMSGLGTIAQLYLGIRLPVMETSTVVRLGDTVYRQRYELAPCPENQTNATEELWKSRMTEIQGTLAVGSLSAICIGSMGIVGMMQRWLTPLTLTPTITLMGVTAYFGAAIPAATCWPLAVVTAVLIITFAHFARPVKGSPDNVLLKRMNDVITCLTIFPILVAIALTWFACFLLTKGDVFPADHPARTDNYNIILAEASWFRAPYPFQWGMPTFHWETAVRMMFTNLVATMGTVCDYYACAVVAGISPPPPRAANRGVFIEGMGCLWSATFGGGYSYETSDMNLGVIALTKCASVRVIKLVAWMMVVFGIVNKLSVFVLTIPPSIVGGLLLVLLATFVGVGLAHLRYVDLTSNRNVFIVGMSLVMGLLIPASVRSRSTFVMTNIGVVDRLLFSLATTFPAVGGITGCVLDHTLPGTEDERGITKLRECFSDVSVGGVNVPVRSRTQHFYNVPCFERMAKRWPFLRSCPLMPEKEVHANYIEE